MMAKEFGRVVVIRRDGKDGPAFPLTSSVCLFGRLDAKNISSFLYTCDTFIAFLFCIFWIVNRNL